MNCWRFLLDLTPLSGTSTLTGYQFNCVLKEVFGDLAIENLWLPFFCLTTDLTSSQMKIHATGEHSFPFLASRQGGTTRGATWQGSSGAGAGPP